MRASGGHDACASNIEVDPTSARARRFSLQLPIRYRAVGEAGWHNGTTENISRSGVLFRVADILQVDTPIEMRLVLPVGGETQPLPELLCQGRIVRAAVHSRQNPQPTLAAAITKYRIRADASR